MSFTSRVKKLVKPFVDVPRWMGYRQWVETNRTLYSFVKNFFVPDQAGTGESFDAALARLQLTEEDLANRLREFRRLRFLWIVLCLASLAYAAYLLSEHALRGFFPCIGFSLALSTQVFRYHFWIFQLKNRRLGCTFRDWFKASFGDRKQPS